MFSIMEEKHVKKALTILAALIAVTLSGCTVSDKGSFAPHTKPTASTGAKAANKPAPTKAEKQISAEQRNATRTAQSYLGGESGFSRKSLIAQLKYEGYSIKAATAAVDSLGVNWNAQAALKAQSYLEGQPFSRTGLINQLKYEGFTSAQAAYGVKRAGL